MLDIARLTVNGISANENYRQTRGCRIDCALNKAHSVPA